MLEAKTVTFTVTRHIRPNKRCSTCSVIVQAPAAWPGFEGKLQGDAYAGFEPLFIPRAPGMAARVLEIACFAHVRRKWFDLYEAHDSPLARDHRAFDQSHCGAAAVESDRSTETARASHSGLGGLKLS